MSASTTLKSGAANSIRARFSDECADAAGAAGEEGAEDSDMNRRMKEMVCFANNILWYYMLGLAAVFWSVLPQQSEVCWWVLGDEPHRSRLQVA